MKDTRLYSCWNDMKQRCYNVNCKSFSNYGGRGITVCKEWLDSFDSFQSWALSAGYLQSLTLDRIDVDKHYCPNNCRWSDRQTQAINKRVNGSIPFYGVYLKQQKGRKPKYMASLTYNGKKKYIGLFNTAIEAAQARDTFIRENNLDYPLNFP